MKENIVEFKTVSPLFEMERDGIKPFTTRKLDPMEERMFSVAAFLNGIPMRIQITNPINYEGFERKVSHVSVIPHTRRQWLNIHWSHPKSK